jgi:DNA-binding MarR family transcriptional regulator
MPEVSEQARALGRLIEENRALFHVMKAAAERIHQEGGRSAARRGVLMGLHRTGPQTVPQIARARPVSRQHIQVLVNGLIDDGLVEAVPNPAHQRSPLIRLTEDGRCRVANLRSREAVILASLDVDVSPQAIDRAAAVVAAVQGAFRAFIDTST